MDTMLFRECCPECGHMLTNDRTQCPFCHWSMVDIQTNAAYKEISLMDILSDEDLFYAYPQNEQIKLAAVN